MIGVVKHGIYKKESLLSMKRTLSGLLLSMLIISCASVSVKDQSKSKTNSPWIKPDVIYIVNFTPSGEFNVDREGAELQEFKKDSSKSDEQGSAGSFQ